jgi:hypothetical protein
MKKDASSSGIPKIVAQKAAAPTSTSGKTVVDAAEVDFTDATLFGVLHSQEAVDALEDLQIAVAADEEEESEGEGEGEEGGAGEEEKKKIE